MWPDIMSRLKSAKEQAQLGEHALASMRAEDAKPILEEQLAQILHDLDEAQAQLEAIEKEARSNRRAAP
ncbi:MAG: hypothetical protein JKP96_11465 [Oceanicaulis sp.]|jgi:hypothetical protein|nr:hypothetical protein [Oceanicaulis sp.]